MNATALPCRAQHLGDGRLDAFMGIGDGELTPRRPRRVSLRRNSVQIGSASEVPTSMPSTSRRPPALSLGMRSSTVPARVSHSRWR